MARIAFKITSRNEVLAGVTRRVKAGFKGPVYEAGKRAMTETLDEEFRRQSFATRGGGFKVWKRRHPLSKKTGPLLGGVGGRVHKSWTFAPSQKYRLVMRSRLPDAAVHRGSTRGGPRETTTRIMPKRFDQRGRPLMWGALLRKGIVTSPGRLARRGVVVPSRPHAGPSKALRRRFNRYAKRAILTGR